VAQKIRDIMTSPPVTLGAEQSATDAASAMKENDVGDVIVMKDDRMCGLVTDRDLAVRVVAEGLDPQSTRLDAVCTSDVVTIGPDDDVEQAIRIVRERAVRRVPVVEGDRPVGIVSIGDLAIERDETSALADVSAAPSNN
jgi:CBS domain-containing protein